MRSKTLDEWVTDLTADLRLPWQRPARTAGSPPGPAGVPEDPREPALPGQCAETRQTGPDARQGSKNRRPAQRHSVGKTEKKTAAKNLTKQTG